ncbi:SPO22-domain-containing protein [Hypoxylon sp. FL0543]|nr:SPO22-domain-containing protein [Hypoxylon sp. FL0543]
MAATSDSPHSAREKVDVKHIISFCRELPKRLPRKGEEQALEKLINDLESKINGVKGSHLKSSDSRRHAELDTAATDLWNWCVQIKRQDESNISSARSRFLTCVRVFSFLILALARWGDHNKPGDLLRLEKLAIKAGRSCTVAGELDYARMVLQKAADYNGLLQTQQAKLPSGELDACKRLEKAWKEDRLDVADYTYGKLLDCQSPKDSVSVENLADSCFEIGKDLTAKKNFLLAPIWLERAYESINAQDLDQLSREAIELRLAISQALVRAYINTNTTDGFQKAENHVRYIESGFGDKLVVLLLRLELLLSSPAEVFDSNAYAAVLRRMISSLDISESSFNLMIHHIRKLDDKSPSLAPSILDEFITLRVLPSQHDTWVERAVVLRTQMATAHRETYETIQQLATMFDKVEANLEKALPAAAVLAVQIVIKGSWILQRNGAMWPYIQLFVTPGQRTRRRLPGRKLFTCALQRNNLDDAADVFRSMTESAQQEPMTLYLAYKLALRSRDREMASDCLKRISEASSDDPQYLYACCVDAQEEEDKICAIEALRQLVQKCEYSTPDAVHLPALFRIVIRLQASLMNDQAHASSRHLLIDDTCEVFEGVVAAIGRDPRDKQGKKLFTVQELDWFCKNTYNLGLKNIRIWQPKQSLRIFRCCLSIISQYPKDITAQAADDLSLRAMFCHFLIATVLIALARAEDNIETQFQDYLEMRNHIKGFDTVLEARLDSLDEAMADCILRAESVPGQVLYSTLRKIINQIFSLEQFDNEKLAKYLRCLLKVTLGSEPEFPLKIMEDICRLVKQCADCQKPVPPQEVEWFITTAFNHGVDLYGVNQDELSKKWIAHALTLAHYHQDGGDLEGELQRRQISLKWDS